MIWEQLRRLLGIHTPEEIEAEVEQEPSIKLARNGLERVEKELVKVDAVLAELQHTAARPRKKAVRQVVGHR